MAESHGERPIASVSQRAVTVEPQALHRIQDALRGLRYGTVTVIVQDGVIVQVDRTEKLRLQRPRV